MDSHHLRQSSDVFTQLSDRFRSLWTFYQFLGGVFKHLDEGALPYVYDFQALYRRLQDLAPRMDVEISPEQQRELERVERELVNIHEELARIEGGFPPSLLRRFFDHLKRQDEKILFALVKFYLMSDQLGQDAFDKLDILLTRLAEVPLDDGRVLPRDPDDMRTTFNRLAEFGKTPPVPRSEERPLVDAVKEFRREIADIADFPTLLNSQVFDRYRRLKQRLGRAFLHPPILVEIISCNIDAKNRFRTLYQQEEVRILEDTNRILEIERYLEKNPDLAHEELRRQIDLFRRSRVRYDSGRKEGNLKRDDILAMRQAMHRVLEGFDVGGVAPPAASAAQELPGPAASAPQAAAPPAVQPRAQQHVEQAHPEPVAEATMLDERDELPQELSPEAANATELFPPDPLLEASLHKIIYGLEMVAWDHVEEQIPNAREIRHLALEPWEVWAFKALTDRRVTPESLAWELQSFYLTAAALRVKMQEEIDEIARLREADREDRLLEALENSAQSLERARSINERFDWFAADMLYRGDTGSLEQLNRSRFRMLRCFSELWLDHQAAGGLTPL